MRRASPIVALCLLAACGAPSGNRPVAFNEQWPTTAGDYRQVTQAWTRSATLRRDYDKILAVSATVLSPAWRAAYVAHRAAVERMGPATRAQLAARQRAAAAAAYELELLVATYHYEENDLQRGARSTWRVVLVADDGTEVAPLEIRRDRRSRESIRAYFPHAGEFDTAYVARFPRSVALLAPSARQLALRVASARGGVELTWTAARR